MRGGPFYVIRIGHCVSGPGSPASRDGVEFSRTCLTKRDAAAETLLHNLRASVASEPPERSGAQGTRRATVSGSPRGKANRLRLKWPTSMKHESRLRLRQSLVLVTSAVCVLAMSRAQT